MSSVLFEDATELDDVMYSGDEFHRTGATTLKERLPCRLSLHIGKQVTMFIQFSCIKFELLNQTMYSRQHLLLRRTGSPHFYIGNDIGVIVTDNLNVCEPYSKVNKTANRVLGVIHCRSDDGERISGV